MCNRCIAYIHIALLLVCSWHANRDQVLVKSDVLRKLNPDSKQLQWARAVRLQWHRHWKQLNPGKKALTSQPLIEAVTLELESSVFSSMTLKRDELDESHLEANTLALQRSIELGKFGYSGCLLPL